MVIFETWGWGEVTRKSLICTTFCPAIRALDINFIAHAYFYVITFKILENVPKLKPPCLHPQLDWVGCLSYPDQRATCCSLQSLLPSESARMHACFLRAAFSRGGWGGGDLATCSLMGKGAVCSLSGEVTHSNPLPWLSCFK